MDRGCGTRLEIAGLASIASGTIFICMAQTWLSLGSGDRFAFFLVCQYGGLGAVILGTLGLVAGLLLRYRAEAEPVLRTACARALLLIVGGLVITGLDYPIIRFSLGSDPDDPLRAVLVILGLLLYLGAHMLVVVGIALPQLALGVKRLSWAGIASAPLMFPAAALGGAVVDALGGGRVADIWLVSSVFIVPTLILAAGCAVSLRQLERPMNRFSR